MSHLVDLKEQIKEAMKRHAVEEALVLCREAMDFEHENFEDCYSVQLSLALCLLETRPKEQNNIEEAKEIYLGILEDLTIDDWERRSSIFRNLGVLFEERNLGNWADNVREAVAYYEKAAAEVSRDQYPDEWGLLMAAAGLAGAKISKRDSPMLSRTTTALKAALNTLSSGAYSEELIELEQTLKELGPSD